MPKNTPVIPTMRLTTSPWQGMNSFSLMPISNDCPYVEALYNPMAKTLAIIGKTKKDSFHMVPRMDDNGKAQMIKNATDPQKPFKMQRIEQESYTEYYISVREEVEAFIKEFATNHEDYDYKTILDMETMEDASTSGVLPGPNAGKKGKIISLTD